MNEHIKKLQEFIRRYNPKKEIECLACSDSWTKNKWTNAQKDISRNKIKSKDDVEFLIKCFQKTVETSPKERIERNKYKDDMLIAQYKAICGIRKWVDNERKILPLRNQNFPTLTEKIAEEIINKMTDIIRKI